MGMNRDVLLLINRLDFLNLAEKILARELFDQVETLLVPDLADWEQIVGRRFRAKSWDVDLSRRLAEADACWLASGRGGVLQFGQAGYPPWLATINEAPYLLFFSGRPPEPEQVLLAVVGTRQPSEAGRLAAWEMGRECALAGCGLVSGLARGIDGAAHAGCVRSGGYSVGVLAGGVDQISPRSHRLLARGMIDAGGALMSEFGPGTATMKWHFPVRNRIISGLCPATVVIEAPEKSGALITAQYGLEQGRDVYVHRAGVESPQGTGTSHLADSGATVIRSLGELDGYGPRPDS